MKNKLLMAATVAAITGFNMSAQANPSNPFTSDTISGTSLLKSSSKVGDYITIFWGVNKVGLTYTYNYEVYNTSAVFAKLDSDTVDNFNVGFDASAVGAATGVSGGVFNTADADGVTWDIAPVLAGDTSGTLDYTSIFPPIMGNAGGNDKNPPAPWASDPYGQQVPVPNLPDSGTTVALLGLGLAGCTLAGRKLKQA